MADETCNEVADGAPTLPCQLGSGHKDPFHIHANENLTFQWSNGPDGYVPEHCPDPAAHENYFD